MRQIVIIVLLMGTLAHCQDSASIKVIARSLPDKVMLRWAVDQPLAWKKANEYGFLVERITISRNGEAVIPPESQMLTSYPLKPQALERWEALATQDQNAAVVAQALYGDSFEVDSPSGMGTILAINEELEQRYTFGLVAAEQNYEAAKLAGWGFEDVDVLPEEKYVYKVRVPLNGNENIAIKEGSVYASPDFYEELPKPIGLAGVFGDTNVVLSWDFGLLQNIYTNYSVERSVDKINYEQLNGVPIFNAQQPRDGTSISLFYNDSIPNNTLYYYRVKGKTAFGETGPPSDILEGMAKKSLAYVPHISRKLLPDDNTVILQWDFDPKGNTLISGFELRRSNTNKGPYNTVKRSIPPSAREITHTGVERVNYFTIVALGKNGAENASFPALVQPVDSIPPKPPTGLLGAIDTTGIVRLSWSANIEEDLSGYRVYRANNPNAEYSQITKSTIFEETYTDTVAVKNLNEKIYYKLVAEDQRYNSSSFSEPLVINKPDLSPPSPPLWKSYKVTAEGVELLWVPSSSDDVVSHTIYRKNLESEGALWENIAVIDSVMKTVYIDTDAEKGNRYSYTVVAKDKVQLESAPADQLEVVVPVETMSATEIKFSATPNRELRFINLSWRIKNADVLEFKLYRGSGENALQLYKILDGDSKGFNDTDLEINTNYVYGLQGVFKDGSLTEIKKITTKY